MKFSIRFFDDAQLEFGVDRGADGELVVTKVFHKFLERRRLPHLTAFVGKFADLHFTAGNGRRAFRRTLAKIPEAALTTTSR